MKNHSASARTTASAPLVGCSVLLLAWAMVFGAAIIGNRGSTGWQLLTNAALLVLSSAGTITSAIWLKLERRAHGDTGTLENTPREAQKALAAGGPGSLAAEPHREDTAATESGRTGATVEAAVEVFWLVFVLLGAVSAWSASSRQDMFRAFYFIVLLWSLCIVKSPIKRLPTRVSVSLISASAFSAIALGHVVRLFVAAPVSIGWWSVPEGVSVAAACVAVALAVSNFRLRA